MVKAFDSSVVNLEITDSIVNFLPPYFKTTKNNMFFNSSINELFRKGDGVQLNGYIGSKPDWYNPTTDFYINEINSDRQNYQLDPTMVSLDENLNYTTAVYFSDYVKNLGVDGALTNNPNRLFEQEYMSWSPPIQLDMFINYRLYYWVSTDTLETPDYITIDPSSSDQNPWSLNNKWKHIDDITSSGEDYSNYIKALRPIIQFIPNIELYNYGTYRRHNATFYDPTITSFSSLFSNNQCIIDGVTIDQNYISTNGPVYVFVNTDTDQYANNKIYEIVWVGNKLRYQVVTDGQDPSGNPVKGEIVKITSGTYANNEYYYDGVSWNIAQSKNKIGISAPLFNLYSFQYNFNTNTDSNILSNDSYISLTDTTTFPNTSFNGNKIFSYSIDEDEYYSEDTVLDLYINQDSNGNILFENYLLTDTYTYSENLTNYNITGYYFYKVNDETPYFSNNWYKKSELTKQWIVDDYISDGVNNVYELSQTPYGSTDSDIEKNIIVTINSQSSDSVSTYTSTILTYNTDYIVSGTNIVIFNLEKNDLINIRTYSPLTTDIDDMPGYYELPVSLSSNCTYENITTFSMGDVYQQFMQIISNQSTFTGDVYGSNTYRNITPDFSLGNSIIETSSSILLNMIFSSSDIISIPSSFRYVANQYRIYKFNFINKISFYYENGLLTEISSNVGGIVDQALEEISRGKTLSFPFYNSGVGITTDYTIDRFIPPTPSFLGLTNPTNPYVTYDYTAPTKPLVLIGHDGSQTLLFDDVSFDNSGNPTFTDPRDYALYLFEQRIYSSINYNFKQDDYKPFDVSQYVNNGFNTNREYSIVEWNSILEQNFLYWVANNNIDYRINSTYDETNPFSWNWSSVTSNVDGSQLLGSWRGIYQYYYGTDAPHYKPWEMLGFKSKPSYWDSSYGPAPYTNKNQILWDDIENGVIASGSDAGTYPSLARPGLTNYIPVDNQGYLLDPVQAGIAKNYPSSTEARNSWNFGDMSPIENVWRRTSEFSYAFQLASYLAKPSMYMSRNWDSFNIRIFNYGLSSEQWIDIDTLNRPTFNQYTVHGETINGSFVYKYGLQTIISNYIVSQSLNITTELGNPIRGLDVRLGHRLAGFVNSENMVITSESYGVLPSENTKIFLYESPTNENIFYSGIFIIKQNNGWKVYGYDQINPYFNIYNVETTSTGYPISVENDVKVTISQWEQKTHYKKGQLVLYYADTYLCIQDHISSAFFESQYWEKVSHNKVANVNTVTWYNTLKNTDIIKIPYGTLITTYQDMCNLLNGIQNYYESVGIRFDQNTNNSWSDIMKNFMTWDITVIGQQNAYIAYSPLSGNVTINNGNGNIKDIFNVYDNFYGIIDVYGKNIKENNVRIVRSQNYTSVVPTDSVTGGIFGCRFYKNDVEHLLLIDNTTIFNDVINSPKYNVKQSRLGIETFKTGNWTGRMIAPGFIVSGNTIIPNFDTTAENFRHFYDIEETFYNTLQERVRLNIGYFDKSYFNNMLITSTNQFEYYQGMIQFKGTSSVINRLMRSSYISNNRNLEFNEEWAIRVGTYGADDIDQSFDLLIENQDFSNNPQLFEFDTETISENRIYNNTFIVNGNETFSLNDMNNVSPETTEYTGNIEISTIEILVTNQTGIFTLSDNNYTYINKYDVSNGSTYINVNRDIYIDTTTNMIINTSENMTITIIINYTLVDLTVTDPQSNHIVINDLKSTSGKMLVKYDRWISRFSTNDISFPTNLYSLDNNKFLPTAGYVSIDTVKWTAVNKNDFLNLYSSTLLEYPKKNITQSYTFNLSGSPRIVTQKLIDGEGSGYYRINYVQYQVTKSFDYDVTVNIGTPSQLPSDPSTNNFSSSAIYRINSSSLDTLTTVKDYPTTIIYQNSNEDTGIYLQFDCSKITSIPDTIILGTVTITLSLEWVNDSILPNDRAWVYNTGYGDWMTYKLYNPNYIIDNISTNIQGNPVVSLPYGYTSDNNITLSNILPENGFIILDGVQNNSQFNSTYTPRYQNTISTLIDSSSQSVTILDMNDTAGMQISSMKINVIKPFTTTDNSELSISIGTTDNTSLVGDSSVISNPYPTVPSFDQSTPVTVQVANPTITYLTYSPTANIYVTRSGNIYNIPNQCSDIPDTSFTWTLYGTNSDGTVNTSEVISNGTAIFGNPDDSNASKESLWLQSISVQLSNNLSQYAFVITGITGNGTISSQSTTFINLSGQSTSYVLFDPTVEGFQNIDPRLLNIAMEDGPLTFNLGSNTTGTAYITIEYTYSNGFELQNVDGSDISNTTVGNGGNIFSWVPTRYSTESSFLSSNYSFAYQNNDYIEIDNNNSWLITQYENGNLNTIISQSPQVNSDLIDNAILYNNSTKIIEQTLELIDPLKGYIPGVAKQYIDYISTYDPARYTNTNNNSLLVLKDSWGQNEVGKLWWNISTTFYIDYDQGDYQYKWKNWASMAPGSSVDIYEWVRSPVLPSAWNSYVSSGQYSDGFQTNPSGTVTDNVNTNWVEEEFYDENKNITITYYYFWVLLPTTCDTSSRRQTTATQLSYIIENPFTSGIPYFSIIDSNKILIGGVKQFVDNDTVLKVNWKLYDSDNNFHKQWMIIREDDDQVIVDQSLWNKMVDSVIGYKQISSSETLSFTLFEDFYITSTSIVLSGNQSDFIKIPTSGQIKIDKFWFLYNGVSGNKILNVSNLVGTQFDSGTPVSIEITETIYEQVPNPLLTTFEATGILERPLQSWFNLDILSDGTKISSRQARKICIEEINNILSDEPYLDQWYDAETLMSQSDPAPDVSQYIYSADDFDYRNAYINNGLKIGDTVFVLGNSETNGFWTLWKYSPYDMNADSNGFVLINAQKWRLQEGELWSAVDWYADGYSSDNYPQYTYETVAERNANINSIDTTLLNGTLIMCKTQDSNDTRWSWSVLNNGTLVEVAKEKSTIELSDNFYTSNIVYGIDSYDIDFINVRDGTYELKVIFDNFYSTLMSKLQISELFFAMVNGALSLNSYNDWIFKTSFMHIGGAYEQLTQKPTIEEDIIDNIIDYIDTVKPYHVKIRDYTATYTVGPDISNIKVMDFDFPVYYDSTIGSNRILNPTVAGELNYNNQNSSVTDTNIVEYTRPWSEWYENYQNSNYDLSSWDANWNPVRHLKIGVKFDRISCSANSGWDSGPWDATMIIYNSENVNGNDFSSIEEKYRYEYKNYNDFSIDTYTNLLQKDTSSLIIGCVAYILKDETYYLWDGTSWLSVIAQGWDADNYGNGAIERINQYYEPTGSQIQKDDIGSMLIGCGNKSVFVNGDTIEQGVSLMFPWDYVSGFDNEKGYYLGGIDSNSSIVTNYTNQIVGANPAITTDDRGRDVDLSSKDLGDMSPTLPYDIDVDGDDLGSYTASKTPEELVDLKVWDSLVMTITDKDSSGNETTFRISKNNFGGMDIIHLNNIGSTVVQDTGDTIIINSTNSEFPFHDPANPSSEYLDIVKSTMVDMNMSQEDINQELGRLNPGIIWINGEKIVYWSVTKSGNNYIISDMIRGYGITGQLVGNGGFNEISIPKQASQGDIVYDGSVLSWVTYDYVPKITINGNEWYIGDVRVA